MKYYRTQQAVLACLAVAFGVYARQLPELRIIEESKTIVRTGNNQAISVCLALNGDNIGLMTENRGVTTIIQDFHLSADSGTTWVTRTADSGASHRMNVGPQRRSFWLRADGNPLYLMHERTGDRVRLRLSGDLGQNWSAVEHVLPSGVTVGDLMTAAGSLDHGTNIQFTYFDYANTNLRYAVFDHSGGTWTAPTNDVNYGAVGYQVVGTSRYTGGSAGFDPLTGRFRGVHGISIRGGSPLQNNDRPFLSAIKETGSYFALIFGLNVTGGKNSCLAIDRAGAHHFSYTQGYDSSETRVYYAEFRYDETGGIQDASSLLLAGDGTSAARAADAALSLGAKDEAIIAYTVGSGSGPFDVVLTIKDANGVWHTRTVASGDAASIPAPEHPGTGRLYTYNGNNNSWALDMLAREENGTTRIYLAYGEFDGTIASNPKTKNIVLRKFRLEYSKGTIVTFW